MKASTPLRVIPGLLPSPFGFLAACALLLASILGTPGCGGGAGETGGEDLELRLARERAAALFQLRDWEGARAAIAPWVQGEDAHVEDLVRALCIELNPEQYRADVARELAQRALALAPDDPAAHWAMFRLDSSYGDFEQALEHVRFVLESTPDDFKTRLAYANVLSELDRNDEAEREYRLLLERVDKEGASWELTTLSRFIQHLRQMGRRDEIEALNVRILALHGSNVQAPSSDELERGSFGDVLPPTPRTPVAHAPVTPAPPVYRQTLPNTKGALGMAWAQEAGPTLPFAYSLDPTEDERLIAARGLPDNPAGASERWETWRWQDRPARLAVWGPFGLHVLSRTADGTWEQAKVVETEVAAAVPFDQENDGDLDFALWTKGDQGGFELRVLVRGARDAFALGPPLALAAGAVGSITASDFDHDGDLDLLAADTGLRILRNDGAGYEGGGFTPVTWPLPGGFTTVVADDWDRDQDVDYMLANPTATPGLTLIDNRRGGDFVEAAETLPAPLRARFDAVLSGDFDGDSRPDLALRAGERWTLATRTSEDGWDARTGFDSGGSGPALALDWNLDGTVDLLLATTTGLAGTLSPGFDVRASFATPLEAGALGRTPRALLAADVDRDFDFDLLRLDENGVHELLGAPAGNAFLLDLAGGTITGDDPQGKDNTRGIGAIVELLVDGVYRRIFWTGGPQWIGLGTRPALDVCRITWPHGVVQTSLGLASDAAYVIRQKPGLVGSCPFLYTWNGTTYEFVTDVLGITPLGLPMGPGLLVPPDHDEFVLVRGDQLVPKDGLYELQITEELREVTYLDRIRLDVVDHPAGTEIYPNERFTFPPFPDEHTHTVRAPLTPTRVTDQDGGDWTAELARDDRSYAIPFEPAQGQFQGLATPHRLELVFDRELVRHAQTLRLVMTGWFYWTDASVNMAAARHPAFAFVPPLLSVPDGEGGWRSVGPSPGFPAGKLKTMVLDVTDVLVREDPRVSIDSTLRLYWDSIRLAVDDDDAPLVVTSLEAHTAELWERGFSQPVLQGGVHALEWFDWDRKAPEPRWNRHPGLYTRLGDVNPLLGAIDDRFVILGAGDALTVRFDAKDVPPVPAGFVRDYLVFFDGWAKDRDPNTKEALFVEPLPFHGMSGYPYGPDEHYPDDDEHAAYRETWNTRPAQRWIEPLSPNFE